MMTSGGGEADEIGEENVSAGKIEEIAMKDEGVGALNSIPQKLNKYFVEIVTHCILPLSLSPSLRHFLRAPSHHQSGYLCIGAVRLIRIFAIEFIADAWHHSNHLWNQNEVVRGWIIVFVNRSNERQYSSECVSCSWACSCSCISYSECAFVLGTKCNEYSRYFTVAAPDAHISRFVFLSSSAYGVRPTTTPSTQFYILKIQSIKFCHRDRTPAALVTPIPRKTFAHQFVHQLKGKNGTN